MTVYKNSVTLLPDIYEEQSGLDLDVLWVPLEQLRHQKKVLDFVHRKAGSKFDLTVWIQKVMSRQTGYLILLFQNVPGDKRLPQEIIVSNEDGTEELVKVPLQTTRIERLSYTYVEAELDPNKLHLVAILLQVNS